MPVSEMILIAVALIVGFLGGIVIAWWRGRFMLEREQSQVRVDQAVQQTELRGAEQENARVITQLAEAQQIISDRNQALGEAATARAGLTARVEALVRQVAELHARERALEKELRTRNAENTTLREHLSQIKTSLAEQRRHAAEKLALLEQARDTMNAEFKSIANEIFEARQQIYRQESKEQLTGLLNPLSERIREFEKQVSESYGQESKERFSLVKEVKNLQELNAKISQDAVNLTNALKGESKTQGMWGEVVLERVLEQSGLQRGREYEIQVTLKNEDGRRRQPDVIVHLPEGRDVVVDAKVSLTAYERYCSSDDDQERLAALKEHGQSLRRHLKQLSAKDYQSLPGVRSLDFVLLFVPIEAAFVAAVQEDEGLFAAGFERNIVIVSPSTLLATLRTIQNIWRHEDQNKNAEEIALKAGALYDKFVSFVQDLETVGIKIDAVRSAYEDAHNKLVSGRGSLVRRAEGMRELGAKVNKTLPANLVEMPRRDPEPINLPLEN